MKEIGIKSVTPVLLDIPHGFEVDGRFFRLYPQTIGTMQITSSIMDGMDVNLQMMVLNPAFEALRLAYMHRERAAMIVAYNCTRGKTEASDSLAVKEAADYLVQHTELSELALLLMLVLSGHRLTHYMSVLGIEDEQMKLRRAMSVKKDSGSYPFGGVSIYGSLIGPACEKLNMTPDAVIWDISYYNLKLLLADAATTLYLSKEERQQANLPTPGAKTVKVTKENLNKIKAMFKE